MGKKRKPRYWISALVFTALWPITCVGFELDLVGALIAAGVYVLAGIGVSSIISKRRAKKEAAAAAEAAKAEAERREAEAKAKEAKSPYSPEVQAIIREGRLAMKEMGRLYSSIQNPDVRSRINELTRLH